MKKLLMVSAVLLCGVNAVEAKIVTKVGERQAYLQEIQKAKDKNSMIAAVKNVENQLGITDYSYFMETIRPEAVKVLGSDAAFYDAIGLKAPTPLSAKTNIAKEVAAVKVAAQAVADEIANLNKTLGVDEMSGAREEIMNALLPAFTKANFKAVK